MFTGFEKDLLTGKILSHFSDDKVRIEGYEKMEGRTHNISMWLRPISLLVCCRIWSVAFQSRNTRHQAIYKAIHNYFLWKVCRRPEKADNRLYHFTGCS